MALALNLNNLGSRAVRLASSDRGIRRIAINATSSRDSEEGGVLSVYNAIEKFGRSLMSFALNQLGNLFKIDWRRLYQQVIGGVAYILNFNINSTDAQLDDQIKQAEIALAGARGSLKGQSLGFAICGLAPAATIAVFNEPLALYMLKELGEEAADEIAGSLATLVNLQIQQSARIGFVSLFKNHRDIVRATILGGAQLGVYAGFLTQKSVDRANKKRNEPWSIASSLEESVESIDDPLLKAEVENFWDEFGEACIEAGYVLVNSADSYFAMQKIANESQFGTERIIEIQPIRNADEDGVT